MVLDIAEGKGWGGNAERNHYRIALGSVGEAQAVLDLVQLDGAQEQKQKFQRIGKMLSKMSR